MNTGETPSDNTFEVSGVPIFLNCSMNLFVFFSLYTQSNLAVITFLSNNLKDGRKLHLCRYYWC